MREREKMITTSVKILIFSPIPIITLVVASGVMRKTMILMMIRLQSSFSLSMFNMDQLIITEHNRILFDYQDSLL